MIQELTEAVFKNLDLKTGEFKTFIEKAIKDAMTEVKEFSKQAIIYNYSDKKIIQMEQQGEAPENIEDKVGKECQEFLKVDVSQEVEAQIFQQVIESAERLVLELITIPNEQKLEFLKQQESLIQQGGKGYSLKGKYNTSESKKTKIYLDKISKLEESNKELKKNKIKNKNKIEKNNKQINELKEKIKKEKAKQKLKEQTKKEKEKIKKEKEKEKIKKEKEKLKEKTKKEKAKAKVKEEKAKKNNMKTKKKTTFLIK